METGKIIQKIKTEYDRSVSKDKKIAKLDALAKTGMQKYKAASEIASRTGMTTSEVLLSNLLELYPDGNIPEDVAKALVRPIMEHNYDYVSKKATEAQAVINEEAEVGLSAIPAEFDTRQADEIVEKIVDYDDISLHKRDIEKQIEMASRKTVDDTMRVNAEAHSNVGMEVTVTRIYDGVGVHNRKDRCEWCLERCGENMSYREAYAKGAFERHPGCGCEIFYKTGKSLQRQTNWSNNGWEDATDNDIIEARSRIGITNSFDIDEAVSQVSAFANADSKQLYENAKNGGQNAGTYRQAIQKPKKSLESSIKSHLKEVEEHTKKIANPAMGMKKKDPNDPVERKRAIKTWEGHRLRNADQAAIEIEVWRELYGRNRL